MSVTIKGEAQKATMVLRASQLKIGTLYKLSDSDGTVLPYHTLYTRIFGKKLMWFDSTDQSAPIGTLPIADYSGDFFTEAPTGTEVVIRND